MIFFIKIKRALIQLPTPPEFQLLSIVYEDGAVDVVPGLVLVFLASLVADTSHSYTLSLQPCGQKQVNKENTPGERHVRGRRLTLWLPLLGGTARRANTPYEVGSLHSISAERPCSLGLMKGNP